MDILTEDESDFIAGVLSEIPHDGGSKTSFARSDVWVEHGGCSNCGHAIWIVDGTSGDYVCRNCGAVQQGGAILLNVRSAKDRERDYSQGRLVRDEHVQGFGDPGPSKRSRSAPYKRITYFSERISQWAQREPPIPEAHWRFIEDAFYQWCEARGEPAAQYKLPTRAQLRRTMVQLPGTKLLDKEEVRSILQLVDTFDWTDFLPGVTEEPEPPRGAAARANYFAELRPPEKGYFVKKVCYPHFTMWHTPGGVCLLRVSSTL